jgi:nitroreductase
MQPRREVFAQDYIGETIEFYQRVVSQHEKDPGTMDISELEWAHDVLNEYFIATGSSPVIDKARSDFEVIGFSCDGGDRKKAPFKRGNLGPAPISYDDLLELSMRRRSVRWFEQRPVPRELIDKAMLVARQSPTACNRLPYEFRIYDDPALVEKVASLPFGAGGYAHNIPTIIVVVGKLDSYFSPRDRHVIYIDASLAVTPFMYALETLGLASSPINWPDFEPLEIKMQKAIGLGIDERPVMLIAVGYPDPESYVPYSQKKSLDVLRSYNKTPSP